MASDLLDGSKLEALGRVCSGMFGRLHSTIHFPWQGLTSFAPLLTTQAVAVAVVNYFRAIVLTVMDLLMTAENCHVYKII